MVCACVCVCVCVCRYAINVFDSIVYDAGDDGRSPGVGTLTLGALETFAAMCKVSMIILGACRRCW